MSIEKLTEVSGELAAAKAKLQAFAQQEGKAAIGAAFAKCFEPPTALTKIQWTQYTPYFNDGDACVFSANDPELFMGGESEDDENDGEGDDTYGLVSRGRDYCKPDSDYNKERRAKLEQKYGTATVAAFLSVWSRLDDEILLAVFGDHQQITITKDEVTVEEYSHD